jgi:protein phosphatase
VNFLRDLFRRNKPEHLPASTAVETAPIPSELLEAAVREDRKLHPPQILLGMAQSTGMQRDHNEDTLFGMTSILADGNSDLPFGIFIVADGMGGHLNGEVASGAAARAICAYLIQHFYLQFLSGRPGSDQESFHEVMEKGMIEAQRAVLASAPGGGTTLTAALVLGDQVTLSHVGDSRAYFLYSDGRVEVMTQDHSLVKRLQDLGQIDEKEASVHPQRNVLYRALGQSEPFRPDISTHALPRNGYMLLCSDGLWGSVTGDEIARIVLASKDDLPSACQQLVDAANEAGGPDNISAVIIQYRQ